MNELVKLIYTINRVVHLLQLGSKLVNYGIYLYAHRRIAKVPRSLDNP
ncbi:hypothetical protein ES703_80830 [subsurface metagenome]